jgi:hypothetical protein
MLLASGLALKDILTIGVAGASLVVSIAGFLLNRRYTRRTFASVQYPQLRLYGLEVSGKPILTGDCWNDSKVDAINVAVGVVLTRRWRRAAWKDSFSGSGPPPGARKDVRIELRTDALVKLAPESLVQSQNSLILASGRKPPSFGLLV